MVAETGTPYTLFGVRGWGSVLVEAALTQAHLEYTFVDVAGFDTPGPARDQILAMNPLAQVPVLVLPSGCVMTESVAILLYLAETYPDAVLAPPVGDPQRPLFLRRLVWLVAAVYSTFTYTDYPERWAPSAREELFERVLEQRKTLWREWETALDPRPWALGDRFSALDICIAAMTRWRPGRDWFAAECPRLDAIARRVDEEPILREVWQQNFGPA